MMPGRRVRGLGSKPSAPPSAQELALLEAAARARDASVQRLEQELKSARPDAGEVRTLCTAVGYVPDVLRRQVWEVLLGVRDMGTDHGIREAEAAADVESQRVIWVDVERTRGNVPLFQEAATRRLEVQLLSHYCKQRSCTYKQGLNEVMAPFVLLYEDSLDAGAIFNTFYAFIGKFLPHAYCDGEFISLQCVLRLFRLLLRFHDPELCAHMDRHDMLPELYATPWFLTLFAHSTPLDVLYQARVPRRGVAGGCACRPRPASPAPPPRPARPSDRVTE